MDYTKAQIAVKGYQISNYHAYGQTFQIYIESAGVNTTALTDGLNYLRYALGNGIPVIVGINTQQGSHNPNTDNTTDHFVVIVGMGTDAKGSYFRFYDNASGTAIFGTHADNKLYYDANTGIISGTFATPSAQGLTYTITMIRKSKPI